MYKFYERKVWVAGARGMVGSAITRRLCAENCQILPDPKREDMDLRDQAAVSAWMDKNAPDVIFLTAARVGGIGDNAAHPADFIADNLQIETNIITHAAKMGVSKLIFMGSSCIYPKLAPQPLKEEYLLTGPLEKTNRAYAVAKLAGIEMVQSYRAQYGHDFISLLPCNLYGPGDTYDATRSHVIPALMLKFRDAIDQGLDHVTIWGSGAPLREFMHVDDLADAAVHLAQKYSDASPVNVGTGQEISIKDLATMLAEISGFKGELVFDMSKPDGTPRKILDLTLLSASSWTAQIPLYQGLAQTWHQFQNHQLAA